MRIKDDVYGDEEIKEQVLIDLINSEAIQRLKGVSQYGLPQEYYHKPIFSRYEHSIGVLILLRRLNADLNEQIAGLLHDVSHTAFSHVIDWVIGDPTKENYQDSIHKEFIENSEIPGILRKYGINYNKVSNLKFFPLLEREAPGLCADRVDYTLREIKISGKSKIVEKILSDIINVKGQIAFKSKDLALLFAEEYSNCQREHWGGDEARARYYILSNILRSAINKKIISLKDIKNTDAHVISILKKSQDKETLDGLDLLNNGFKIEMAKGEDYIKLAKKFRHIDPEVLINNEVISLSNIHSKYKEYLIKEKERSKYDSQVKISKL